MVRCQFRKLPDAAKTPMPLSDLSISSVPHRTASYFGYEFELPWDDVDEEKTRPSGQFMLAIFVLEMHYGFQPFPQKIL
jgi:hypothetical protein